MKILGLGLIAFFLYTLQQKIYRKYWSENLKVRVFFEQKGIMEGETGEITEQIENRKRLPLTMLKVKFQTSRNLVFEDNPGSNATDQYYRNDIFQIGGGERITRKLTFLAAKRGYYHIKNIDLIGTDLFFTGEMVESMTTSSYLYVYPKRFYSKELACSLQRLNGEVIVKRHLLEDPFSYRGIREYQPYDDMRSVNWKATAKSGDLMVNQKSYTAMQTIRIFLNTEDTGILKKEDAVEASLQVVMGITEFFLAQGMKVAFYANGKDVLTGEAVFIEAGAGAGQQDAIGRSLARMDVKKEPWDFKDTFEALILNSTEEAMTLFVSPNGYASFVKLLEQCMQKKIPYVWFLPYDTVEVPKAAESVEENIRFIKMKR